TTFANTGPGRNSHSPVAGLYTDVPVTSAGRRSGVHCTRPKCPPIAFASDFASNVLPVPGTPSSSRCPPARSATTASPTTSSAPRIALLTAWNTSTAMVLGSRGSSTGDDGSCISVSSVGHADGYSERRAVVRAGVTDLVEQQIHEFRLQLREPSV